MRSWWNRQHRTPSCVAFSVVGKKKVAAVGFNYFRVMKAQKSMFKLSSDYYINGQQNAILLSAVCFGQKGRYLALHCIKFASHVLSTTAR